MPDILTDGAAVDVRSAARARGGRVRKQLSLASVALTCLESILEKNPVEEPGRELLATAQDAIRRAAEELTAR